MIKPNDEEDDVPSDINREDGYDLSAIWKPLLQSPPPFAQPTGPLCIGTLIKRVAVEIALGKTDLNLCMWRILIQNSPVSYIRLILIRAFTNIENQAGVWEEY
ncbi:hypothetical protein Trydic_g8909 [Trypoxylus dichotomus]